MNKPSAFTMIELLVSLVIIAVLATLSAAAIISVRTKARDVKRKADLQTIGRFLTLSCYLPTGGAGQYDFAQLLSELSSQSRYQQWRVANFQDPKSGSAETSNYFYIVDENKRCAVYANLESDSEAITLPQISQPTAGGGTGIWQAAEAGVNGSRLYYQVSN